MENTNESHICFIVPRWWHSVIFEGYFSNLLIVKDLKSYVKKLAPYGECYCNCKSINWTETLPSSKSRDTKTRTHIKNLLHTKVGYCSVVSESVVICQLTLKMAEEIDFENWRITNFKGLVTLTLDRVIRHTVDMRPLPTYQISSESEKLFVDRRTDVQRTDIWPMLLGRLRRVDLKTEGGL